MILADPAARLVIAHRGDSAHAPENTFPAFDRAVELGVDALEFDLRLTRDGVAIVMHDATVDRTTDGTGAVRSLTSVEIASLDAGARFSSADGSNPYQGARHPVPTFEQMLERYPGVPFLIEVKVHDVVDETRRLIAKHGARSRVMLDSTVHDAVEPFRRDRHTTGASLRDVVELLPFAWLPGAPTRLPYQALCIPRWYNGIPVPIARLAAVARRAGVATHVWTVNDEPSATRLWSAGVSGIITDDPARVLALRARLATND